MMECRNVQEACLADTENGLSEEARAHLRDCTECAGFAASARRLTETRQDAAPPPELDRRILAAARTARPKARPVLRFPLRPILWAAAAVFVAGLFATRMVTDDPEPESQQPQSGLAWEQLELEGDILALAAEMAFAELPDAQATATSENDSAAETTIETGIIELETELLLRQLEFAEPTA